MKAKGGTVIPFNPTDNDVVSTKGRNWNLNHPGVLAYQKLVGDYVGQLPPPTSSDHKTRLQQLARQIIKTITEEKNGRFLKIDPESERLNQCILMDDYTSMHKVKCRLLREQQLRLKNKKKGAPSPPNSVNSPEVVSPSSSLEERSSETEESSPLKISTGEQTIDNCVAVSTPRTFHSYPNYVHNPQNPMADIDNFLEGLKNAKRCCCGHAGCYLFRPSSVIFTSPDIKPQLANTIVEFHCQEQYARSSSLSKWFVKKNKYRLTFSEATAETREIHLCNHSLCRILGLTQAAKQNMERDERLLVFMRQQAKEGNHDDKSTNLESHYQKYEKYLQGNNLYELALSTEQFYRFWEVNMPYVEANLHANENRRRITLLLNFILEQAKQEINTNGESGEARYQKYVEHLENSNRGEMLLSEQQFHNVWEANMPIIEASLQEDHNRKRSLTDDSVVSAKDQPAVVQPSEGESVEQPFQPTRASKRIRKATEKALAIEEENENRTAKQLDVEQPRTKKPTTKKLTGAGRKAERAQEQIVAGENMNQCVRRASRRVSMDGMDNEEAFNKPQGEWRCGNCFHQNPKPLEPEPRPRQSVVDLNRRHVAQRRKSRFARRTSFHSVSRLSRF